MNNLIFWQAEVNYPSAAYSDSLRNGGEKLSQERYLKWEAEKKVKIASSNQRVSQVESVLVKLFIAHRWSQVWFKG